jgi:hypothetical protein
MGGSQSCLNHPNLKLGNVGFVESTQNDIVTTTIVVPQHNKCQNGKTITIRRPTNFKTLDLTYEFNDEKGGRNVNQYVYQMKEGFGNTVDEDNKSEGSVLNMNAIISLVIIALVVLYIYRNNNKV